jgi:hypothetical protein
MYATKKNHVDWVVKQNIGPNIVREKFTCGFKVIELWPLNPKRTNDKTLHGKMYITCIKHQKTMR